MGGVAGAAVSTLSNLQMELRKTCNHPFLIKVSPNPNPDPGPNPGPNPHLNPNPILIKGVEAAKTAGMSEAARRETFLSASGEIAATHP